MVLRRFPRLALLLSALLVAGLAFAAACGGDNGGGDAEPTATVENTPVGITPSNVDETLPAVVAARAAMAESFDTEASAITILSADTTTFSDSCLDVTTFTPTTPEVCAQVITPGYVIVMQVGTTIATYHSDDSGENVRFAGVDVGGGPTEIDVP